MGCQSNWRRALWTPCGKSRGLPLTSPITANTPWATLPIGIGAERILPLRSERIDVPKHGTTERLPDKCDAGNFPRAPFCNCWVEQVFRGNQEAEFFRHLNIGQHLDSGTTNTLITDCHIDSAVHGRRYNPTFFQYFITLVFALIDYGIDARHGAFNFHHLSQ